MKDGALEFPSDADTVVQFLATAMSGLPQLLTQIGGWLRRRNGTGRLEIGYGDYEDDPYLAVADIGALLGEAAPERGTGPVGAGRGPADHGHHQRGAAGR